MDVLLAVHLEAHGAPTVGAGKGAGAHVPAHVHGSALVVVAHQVHHLVHIHLVVRFNPKGHTLGLGVAHGVFLILEGLAVHAVEHGVHTGVAAADAAEGERCVSVAEGELLVLAVEPAASAGIGDDVGGIDAFHLGLIDVVHVHAADGGVQTFALGLLEFLAFQGELGDAGLVGVAAHIAVRYATGNPHGTLSVFILQFLGQVSLHGGSTLANQLKDPHLVGVADGEALALAAIAIVCHQLGHPVDGLAGILGTLQCHIDQRAIVDALHLVLPALLASAVGRLADGQLVFVHVAHHAVGVSHLRDFKQLASAVPVHQHEHRAGRIVGCLAVVQLAIQRVAVRGIGNHGAAILGSPFCEKEIGTGRGFIAYRKDCGHQGK